MEMFYRAFGCSVFFEAISWANADLVVAEAQFLGILGYKMDSFRRQLDKTGIVWKFYFYSLFEGWYVYPFGDEVSDAVVFCDILVVVSMVKSLDS